MLNKIDRYIIARLLTITLFVLVVLIFIFIIIDFSNNSDDFTDRGATMAQIWGVYYLNYIPEMVRLVTPEAVFIACLILTGQMSDRLEIIALKAAGVSLYRLIVPYLTYALVVAAILSYMDAFIVPHSNATRLDFEKRYIRNSSGSVERDDIYRQLDQNTILRINYFDDKRQVGYQADYFVFEEDSLTLRMEASKMEWVDSTQLWHMIQVTSRRYTADGVLKTELASMDTTLPVFPRDLARRSSDIYQLTYPEVVDYIASLERSGAQKITLPKVQFYGRLAYPTATIIVTIIGFAIASVRRKGGKGVYLAAGLIISFFYLAFMKLAEPFGASGEINPAIAASVPHLFFLVVGLILLVNARK